MLKACLNNYGIEYDLSIPIFKLQYLAFKQHPSGYEKSGSERIYMSQDEAKNFLNLDSAEDMREVFRYAGYFGIIHNVVISPYHVEWAYNPRHQNDLFFSMIKMQIREEISSL